MLGEYFRAAEPVTLANAWEHVYRLLLWIDRTTGLAHCYESDKAQPGRPWYGRSLAFHDWVARSLRVEPIELGAGIDWLFKRATERLATLLDRQQKLRVQQAAKQRAPYADRIFPEPGQNPLLEGILLQGLGPYMSAPPSDEMRRLVQRIQAYFGEENKRKNLVGEGFEDVLSALIRHAPGLEDLIVSTRPALHLLPGFRRPPVNEKPRKVDLALIGAGGRRTLVSAKWSVRADREEQFGVDFETYSRLEDAGEDFDFVLVTNEFDPARLVAACERRRPNGALFSSVVHVNADGPLAAYGDNPRRSAAQVLQHIAAGRLISLESWLTSLSIGASPARDR